VHGATLCEVCRGMTVPLEYPLCGQQPLHTHGAPGVNTRCADANFCTCTKNSITVRKILSADSCCNRTWVLWGPRHHGKAPNIHEVRNQVCLINGMTCHFSHQAIVCNLMFFWVVTVKRTIVWDDTVHSGTCLPVFRRIVLPLFIG
jgi:hypothetical protein